MPAKRFFWFAYMLNEVARFLGRSDSFEHVIHMIRDGAAHAEVQAVLSESLGWSYAGVILNLPASELEGKGFAPAPAIAADDVIELVGRPPLDDDKDFDRRIVYRSDSDLEDMVFRRLRKVYRVSRRASIILQPELCPKNDLRAVMYRITNHGRPGTIYRHGACTRLVELGACEEQRRNDTLGYLAWVPGDPEAGIPGILNVFGISGPETMLWSACVRRHAVELIRELVDENQLRVIAARFTRPVMDSIPLDLSMVDDWGEIDWVFDSKYEEVANPT